MNIHKQVLEFLRNSDYFSEEERIEVRKHLRESMVSHDNKLRLKDDY